MSFLDSPIFDDAQREFEEEPDDWEHDGDEGDDAPDFDDGGW